VARAIQLAPYASLYPGAFVPTIHAVLDTLGHRGWSAEAVFTDEAQRRDWARELARVGPIRFVSPAEARQRRTIATLLAERPGPVILHTHFTLFDVPAALAGARRGDVAVFWHVHSGLSASFSVRLRNVLKFSIIGRLTDRILCVGSHLVEELARRGAPREKLVHFPNAIDTEHFSPISSAEREEARRRLGVNGDTRVLLHYAWDWRKKGGDLFLNTVKHLLDEAPFPIAAVSVGGGAAASELSLRLGIEKAVTVHAQVLDVRRLLAACDLFISSGRTEGAPIAVAEALCSGVPVVASDIPGHAEFGEHLRARRLAPLEPRELARAARELLERDAQTAEADAAAARQWVLAEWDLRVWTDRLLYLYEEALGERRTT
jgi:glycosyltransferase involved in cell wall biosynthesis